MSLRATRWAWTVPDLSPTQLLVLLRLADHANDFDLAWPAISSLEKSTRLGRRTVIRALERLAAKEWLEITSKAQLEEGLRPRCRADSNVYRLLIGPRLSSVTVAPDGARSSGVTVAPDAGNRCQGGTGSGVTVAPKPTNNRSMESTREPEPTNGRAPTASARPVRPPHEVASVDAQLRKLKQEMMQCKT